MPGNRFRKAGRSGAVLRPLFLIWLVWILLSVQGAGAWTPDTLRFAVIGDYGRDGPALAAVAALIRSWQVDLIITVGDNNYPDGAAETIDENIGKYFHDFIHPYRGRYGPGARVNRFFPAMGNHDWYSEEGKPFLDYFTLPGNERYYEFARGPVHFFCLSSDRREPDGRRKNSRQARWLREALSRSDRPWKVVYLHHPPYSSGRNHGSTRQLQWPFREWGASVVIAGHDHLYERLEVDGLTYFVNGLGGKSKRKFSRRKIVPGSKVRFHDQFGAMRVTATEEWIRFEFITIDHQLIDRYTLHQSATE